MDGGISIEEIRVLSVVGYQFRYPRRCVERVLANGIAQFSFKLDGFHSKRFIINQSEQDTGDGVQGLADDEAIANEDLRDP
jgi:hypothetical protein